MKTPSKNVSLQDISKFAGVSVNTVAKVLAGKEKSARISPKTAEMVRKIAKKHRYIPNISARNLRAKHSGMIGVFIADMSDSAYITISHLILQELHEKGFSPLLTVAEIGIELCIQEWLQNRIEGIILCGTTKDIDTSLIKKLKNQGIVAVIAGCEFADQDKSKFQNSIVSTVSIDNYKGIKLAINHLLDTKKQQIAHITGPLWHTDAILRCIAYEDIIKDFHKPIVLNPYQNDIFWKMGYSAASKIIDKICCCDAIIAYDDQVAIGAMKYLIENNIRIPECIAVIGFDNTPHSESCVPSLTSIEQPVKLIAQNAVAELEAGLKEKTKIQKILVEPTIIVRNSTQK